MSYFRITAEQYVPVSVEQAWEFLSNPANLSLITPPQMNFEILSGGGLPMYAGQVIHYNVSPFKGIRTRWVTEITHVEDPFFFVDEQRFGPYAFWHHKHFIHPVEGGVRMEDIVDYKLPFGPLGRWMHSLLVKSRLNGIFSFRESELKRRFGEIPGRKAHLQIQSV